MTTVIKLGGAALKNVLNDSGFLDCLVQGLFRAKDTTKDSRFVIVHGGGPEITQLAERFGIESKFYDGQRITSEELLDIVQLVLCGRINPKIVSAFCSRGLRAVGLSGLDDKLLQCEPDDPRLGKVGIVRKVRTEVIEYLLTNHIVPIIAPIGIFSDQTVCNVNADIAAASVAKALSADRLLFLTDRDGILDDHGNPIAHLKTETLKSLSDSKVISGGMKVKARAILSATEGGSKCEITVINGLSSEALSQYFQGFEVGTKVL